MCTSWRIVVKQIGKTITGKCTSVFKCQKISFSNSWLCFITLGHESRREKSVTELNKEQSKRRLSRKQLAQDFASADSVSLSKVLEVYLVASSFTQ